MLLIKQNECILRNARIHCPSIFPIWLKKLKDSDFVRCFEDETQMKISSEIYPLLKEWTNWLEQDAQVQDAVEEIFNSNPEYIDWKTKFFDYTDGNSYITLAQTKRLTELCSKKFDFRQFSNCKLCFIHSIFSFFGFWYFGHFSCVIFFPIFFCLAHLALQNVNKDYIIFLYF